MVVKAFNAAALQSTPVVSGDLHESDYDKLRELCPTTRYFCESYKWRETAS
jgi:hypothetical protein